MPNEPVNATVLSMAAELGLEEDQTALREAERVPEAIVSESHEPRWVFAKSRRVVSRASRCRVHQSQVGSVRAAAVCTLRARYPALDALQQQGDEEL
ncbi:MAG: hypothetical protein HY791_21140 [Deltaproteobacteria bacterium]|nr:hypothetical protein [Deltaproteobacteria bacterium]